MTPSPLLLMGHDNPKREQLQKRLSEKSQRAKVMHSLFSKIQQFVNDGKQAEEQRKNSIAGSNAAADFRQGYHIFRTENIKKNFFGVFWGIQYQVTVWVQLGKKLRSTEYYCSNGLMSKFLVDTLYEN